MPILCQDRGQSICSSMTVGSSPRTSSPTTHWPLPFSYPAWVVLWYHSSNRPYRYLCEARLGQTMPPIRVFAFPVSSTHVEFHILIQLSLLILVYLWWLANGHHDLCGALGKIMIDFGTAGERESFLSDNCPPMGIYETLYAFRDAFGSFYGN